MSGRAGTGRGGCERIWATSVLSLIDKTPGSLHGNTGHLAPGNTEIIRTKHGINPLPAFRNGNTSGCFIDC